MINYERLLLKLNEYLEKEEVVENGEVISAYTLWRLLQRKIKKIHYRLYNNSDLLEAINNYYRDRFSYGGIFYEEAIENLGLYTPLFRPIKFKKIEVYTDENKTTCVRLIPAGFINSKKYVDIYKDYGYEDYYGEYINKYLVNNYDVAEILEKVFEYAEKYSGLITKDSSRNQAVSSSTFSIVMHYSINPNTECSSSLDIAMSTVIDPNRSEYKKYANSFYTIHEFIEGKRDSILKRTPVHIKDLNPLCKTIVKEHLNRMKHVVMANECIESNNQVVEEDKAKVLEKRASTIMKIREARGFEK